MMTHSSMDKFIRKFRNCLSEKFLLSDRDLYLDNGITYIPLYMAPLLVQSREGNCRETPPDACVKSRCPAPPRPIRLCHTAFYRCVLLF